MGENGQGGFGFGGGAGTGEAVECEDILMVPGGKVDYNILFLIFGVRNKRPLNLITFKIRQLLISKFESISLILNQSE